MFATVSRGRRPPHPLDRGLAPLELPSSPQSPPGGDGGRPPREPPQKQNKPSRLQEQPCQKLARAAQPSPKSRFQSRNPAALSTWFKGLFWRTQTLNNFYLTLNPPGGDGGETPPRTPPKTKQASRLQEQPCQKLARAAQPSPKSRFQSRNPAALSTWFKGLFWRTQTLNNFYKPYKPSRAG